MSQIEEAYKYIRDGMERFNRSAWDTAWKMIVRERLKAEKAELKAKIGPKIKRDELTEAQKYRLYRRQDGKCWRCKIPFPISELTDDHLESINKGGGNQWSNRRLLCGKCNSEKRDNDLVRESKLTGDTILDMIPPDEGHEENQT